MDGSQALQRHKFTVDDVLRMIETGVLPEKSRLELRAGELIDTPAEGPVHSNTKSDLIVEIASAIKGRFRMGADTPLRLSDHEWPEPDLFICPLHIAPAAARGTDALLVVEVAGSSLAGDLGDKAALYAKHGVREYWVVDLANARIHVHLLSASGAYGAPRIVQADELVAATFVQGVAVRLRDTL